MKKHIGLVFGVSAMALAGAAGALLGSHGNATEAKADDVSWYVAGSFTNNWQLLDAYKMTETSTNIFELKNVSIPAAGEFKVAPTSGDWQGGWSFNNGESSDEIREIFSASGDASNIVCDTTGIYDVLFNKNSWTITIDFATVVSHTVSFDSNGDGTVDHEVSVVDGETVGMYSPMVFGYNLVGWTLNGVDYDFSTPVTADITLVGKLTARTDAKGYIYLITGVGLDWNTRYIYGWGGTGGENCYGVWKGQLVKDIAEGCTSMVNFNNNNGGIFKVPYYLSDTADHIIVHDNGSGSDRFENTLVNGGGYYPGGTDETVIADTGLAAALVYDTEAAINAVKAFKPSFNVSLDNTACGVSKDVASALVARYDALGENARSYVNASTLYTYGQKDYKKSEDVYFWDIFVTLRAIAAKPDGALVSAPMNGNATSTALVATCCAIGVAAAASCFFIAKKRHQD